MKKILLLLIVIPGIIRSQTFSNQNPASIPANGTELRVPVTVSGLPATIDSTFGLAAVCFNITHEADVNLRISLESPSGSKIVLVDQKGANGNDFTNTCLTESAADFINAGTPPFSGQFIPINSLNLLNDGSDPNGTWYFCITDLFIPTDTGSFQTVLLNFSVNPPPDPGTITGPCSDVNAGACKCPDLITQDCDLYPDITASELSIVQDHIESFGHVMLGVATPNIGWGPLEIHGTPNCYCDTVPVACTNTPCPNGQMPSQEVIQRIYHKTGGQMTYYDKPAGTMSYHPTHNHIHVDNWLYYTLRAWSPDPDPRNWPIVGTGTKQSFCLINLSDCDSWLGYCEDSLGNTIMKSDLPNSDFGHVSGCGVDQGIYVGNIDEYSSSLNGQGIIIPDACNDTYYMVAVVDPLNNFTETKEDNNWAVVPITLTQQNFGNLPAHGFTYTIAGNQLNVLSNETTPDSAIWVWGDGTSDTLMTDAASHIFASAGTYTVFHYAYNHCGPSVSADTIQMLSTSVFNNAMTISAMNVFPNPSNGTFNIEYTLVNATDVTIELFDAAGRKVKAVQNAGMSPGKYRMMINNNSEGLVAGTYTVCLSTSGERKMVRLVVI